MKPLAWILTRYARTVDLAQLSTDLENELDSRAIHAAHGTRSPAQRELSEDAVIVITVLFVAVLAWIVSRI